jgi:hypothetical protein
MKEVLPQVFGEMPHSLQASQLRQVRIEICRHKDSPELCGQEIRRRNLYN